MRSTQLIALCLCVLAVGCPQSHPPTMEIAPAPVSDHEDNPQDANDEAIVADESVADPTEPFPPEPDIDRDAMIDELPDPPEVGDGDGDDPTLACGSGSDEAIEPGHFAARVEIDVWWQSARSDGFYDPGRSRVVAYLDASLLEGAVTDAPLIATAKLCGLELPVFRSAANCEQTQLVIPDAAWDSPSMPLVTMGAHVAAIGDVPTLAFDLVPYLGGIQLDDAASAWPAQGASVTCAAGSGAECFADHDGDGQPGITAVAARLGETETTLPLCGGFALPYKLKGLPLYSPYESNDDELMTRAVRFALGARVPVAAVGEMSGQCAMPIDDAGHDLSLRAIGCSTSVGQDCSADEAAWVDGYMPLFQVLQPGQTPPASVQDPLGGVPLDRTPSPGAVSTLVRLGNLDQTFSCADVRAASAAAPQNSD